MRLDRRRLLLPALLRWGLWLFMALLWARLLILRLLLHRWRRRCLVAILSYRLLHRRLRSLPMLL